jgi:hypothetical protein
MKSQSLRSISTWLLAVPAFPLTAAAQDTQQRTAPPTRYTVTDLGTLPGGNFSQPFFIKRYGLVSGSSSLPDGTQEINDNGEVVGGSGTCATFNTNFLYNLVPVHALLWEKGKSALFRAPVSTSATRNANNRGQVAGESGGRGFIAVAKSANPLRLSTAGR